MIKLVTLLTLVTVVWTFAVYRNIDTKLVSGSVEPATPTSTPLALAPKTLGIATGPVETAGWKIYTNEKLSFRLRYFDGLQIKTSSDNTVSFTKDTLNVSVSQHPLTTIETVNTVAEQDINSKMEKLGDKFLMLESISPIAIGSQTGVSFSTRESGKDITYFYVPQGINYLLIVNKTIDDSGGSLISLSDDLIYSLELIER